MINAWHKQMRHAIQVQFSEEINAGRIMSGKILWIDLETTGSDKENDSILEIGAAVTTEDADLNVLSKFNLVIQPESWNPFLNMAEEVVKMHMENGLIELILKHKGHRWYDARADFWDWFAGQFTFEKKIPVAGSGVCHFDRAFLERDLPDVADRLTYWSYDVGSVRRALRMAGMPEPKEVNKTHRALEDVLSHIDEYRKYLNLFSRIDKSWFESDAR